MPIKSGVEFGVPNGVRSSERHANTQLVEKPIATSATKSTNNTGAVRLGTRPASQSPPEATMPKILTVKATIEIPRVPNFIRMTDGQMLPLSAIENKDLLEIARCMGEAMVKRAAEMRSDPDWKPAPATQKGGAE